MTSTPTEERVQRAARKLRTYFAKGTLSKIENFDGAEHIARAILEAADAPEPQKVVVTEEMLDAANAVWNEATDLDPQDDEYARSVDFDNAARSLYTAMRALEPEPVVTPAMTAAMKNAAHTDDWSEVFLAAHRVLRGK